MLCIDCCTMTMDCVDWLIIWVGILDYCLCCLLWFVFLYCWFGFCWMVGCAVQLLVVIVAGCAFIAVALSGWVGFMLLWVCCLCCLICMLVLDLSCWIVCEFGVRLVCCGLFCA